jgi:hypothetical protein
MTLKLPRYDPSVAIPWDRIAGALFTVDQCDDWLPDPVFYDDQNADIRHITSRVQSLWQSGIVPDP